jgi:hypothetical protein
MSDAGIFEPSSPIDAPPSWHDDAFDSIAARSRPAKPRFLFETMTELRAHPAEEYLIDGWIPERSVGLLYGKWGSGKTFTGFDLALHLAFGLPDWHGAGLPGEPCDVLIIAREGHAGFVKRVDGFKAHHRIEKDSKNLVFMRSPISFLDDAGFAALKADIVALGRPFRFVLVDTVGRVLPGADMAKEAPITLFMERLQQLGELTGGTALGVHHENKTGDANGSMFFQNNSDFMFNTSREGEGDGPLERCKLTCIKQKESDDGWSREVTFAKVELPDGKSTLVVESITEGGERSNPQRSKWTPALRLFRDCVAEALAAGTDHRVGGDGPSVKAVTVQAARTIHQRRYVSTGEGDRKEAERKAWTRGLKTARANGLIGGELAGGQELIWLTS